MVFGIIPDALGHYVCVTMDQHVAKVDDPAVSRNPFDEIGVRFPKAVQRLADDLELAFDRSLRQRIPGICVTVDPFGEALDFGPARSTSASRTRGSGGIDKLA